MIDNSAPTPEPVIAETTMTQFGHNRLVDGLFSTAYFASGPIAGFTLGYPIGEVTEKFEVMPSCVPTIVGSVLGLGLGIHAYFKNRC